MRKKHIFGESGLPKRVERRLERHYGRTPGGRVKLAAALGALGILVRQHPKVLMGMIGAGAIHAARAGVKELTSQVGRVEGEKELPALEGRRSLNREEARRFRKLLDRAADSPN